MCVCSGNCRKERKLQLLYLLHDSFFEWLYLCVPYLSDGGCSVPGAGHKDNEGPVVWVHENAGRLGTGGVERCGAASVGALDTAALQPLYPFPAVHALLHTRARRKRHKTQVVLQGKEGWERKQAKQEGRR